MSSAVFKEGLFEGYVMLVTGGGTGIGLEICKQAGALGASVAICGRRSGPLEEATSLLQSRGVAVFAKPCDIRDRDAVASFVAQVIQHYGRIDVLINNAGGQYQTPAEDCSPKGFNAVVANNLEGGGSIVNIIAQIRNGFPGMVHTGAARAGVDNLTKTCAQEWARFGIRVNAVAPGAIWSSGTARYPPEVLQLAAANQPIKRLGTIEEVAWLTLYLAHHKISSFITGQTYYICGGQSIASPAFMAKL